MHLAYVSDRIASLRRIEKNLKSKVLGEFPEGETIVESEAGDIAVTIDGAKVSVRYLGD